MFCKSFEKVAISTGAIQGALKNRISSAMSTGGRSAGAGVVRAFEAKSAKLGAKGMLPSVGQRTEALKGMVPTAAKQQGSTLDYSKMKLQNPPPRQATNAPSVKGPDVYAQNKSTMLRRNTPYSQV
jgi:hypothetical protein